MLTQEELTEKLLPILKEHINSPDLSDLLLPIAQQHYGDLESRTAEEFETMSNRWNNAMADIVIRNNLRRVI